MSFNSSQVTIVCIYHLKHKMNRYKSQVYSDIILGAVQSLVSFNVVNCTGFIVIFYDLKVCLMKNYVLEGAVNQHFVNPRGNIQIQSYFLCLVLTQ